MRGRASISAEACEVIVLDVGHGNAAIALGRDYALLVDAPANPALFLAIEELGVKRFDFVVISHRDGDHVAGLPTVLADTSLEFGKIFVPTDPTKSGNPQNDQLIAALADAKRSGRAWVSRDLDDALGEELSGGCFIVEVLSPRFEMAMDGPGGKTPKGRKVSSNTASAVIRIGSERGRSILLAGDADRVAFEALESNGIDLKANVLIFPHHGRDATVGDEHDFARWLCSLVGPEQVYFSVARGKITRPSPAVVMGVKEACPNAYIACAQLCQECAPDPLPDDRTGDHLAQLPASGAAKGECCAGSLRITLDRPELDVPRPADHKKFIETFAWRPMCMR